MNLPATLFAVRWLIRDTFRQARASGVFWLMLGVTAICFVVCVSAQTTGLPFKPVREVAERIPKAEWDKLTPQQREKQGVDAIQGKITLAFGAIEVPWTRYREDAVKYVELVLLGVIADSGGILLALVWTAGFLPTFLEPASASVLLAKPAPRWSLLFGKYLGVLIFVGFQAFAFVGAIWFALGVRTGVWDGTCFLAIPVLLVHFGIFFSASVLLAVKTRSTVACMFGSILFWAICVAMNLGRQTALTLPEMQNLPGSFTTLMDIGYWVLPKPADLGIVLVDALQAHDEFPLPFDLKALQAQGLWQPGLALLSSLGFAAVLLWIAGREFAKTDY